MHRTPCTHLLARAPVLLRALRVSHQKPRLDKDRRVNDPCVAACHILSHNLGDGGVHIVLHHCHPTHPPSRTTITLLGCVAMARNLLGFGASNSSSSWRNGPKGQSSGAQGWVDVLITGPVEFLAVSGPRRWVVHCIVWF